MEKLPSTEGDNWRVKIDWTIENEQGENWRLKFEGPRGDFGTAITHNYLLLDRIFGRDEGEARTRMQSIIDEMDVL